MRPTTKNIATQDIISAWFCMTNSWLNIGGFFLSFLLANGFVLNADDMAQFDDLNEISKRYTKNFPDTFFFFALVRFRVLDVQKESDNLVY